MNFAKTKLHTFISGLAVGVAAIAILLLGGTLTGQLQDIMAAGQGTGADDINAQYWNGADWDDSIDLSGTTTLQNVDWASSDNPNTDTQDLSINNNSTDKDDTISLDNGGSVTVADYYETNTDASTKCSNSNTFLAGDGGCETDDYESNTDTQDLSINNNSTDKDDTISLDNGGSVTVADYYESNTDTQDLSINNNSTDKDDTISLDNGGSVTVADYYETNTDASTKCSNSNTFLAGDGGCETDDYSYYGDWDLYVNNNYEDSMSSGENLDFNDDSDTITISWDGSDDLTWSANCTNITGGGGLCDGDDYYEANTDASTECSGDDYLAGDGGCNADSVYDSGSVNDCSDCDSRFINEGSEGNCSWKHMDVAGDAADCGQNQYIRAVNLDEDSDSGGSHVGGAYCCERE